MKKEVLKVSAVVLFGGFLLLSGLTSCKKCAECDYHDENDNEVELGEYCKDDLENIEAEGYYDSSKDTTFEVHCGAH